MDTAFVLGIFRELVVDCFFHVDIVGEVVFVLVDLEAGGVAEAAEVMEGLMEFVVVEQEVSEQVVDLVEEAGRGALREGEEEGEPANADENALGLEILAADECGDGGHHVLAHPHVGLLGDKFDQLHGPAVDGLILDGGVILVSRGQDLQGQHPARSKL